jgi:hypothetical protein
VTVTARTGANVSLTCAVGATTNCSNVAVGDLVTFTATRTATTTPAPTPPANGGNSIGRADRFRTAQEFSARLDFGDGESLDLGSFTGTSVVSHIYTRVGTFTARLVATDVNGDQTTATQIVQVRGSTNGGGSGSFNVTLTLSEPDDDGDTTMAQLDATATVSAIGTATVVRYVFDFGAGSNPSSDTETTNNTTATSTTDYSSAGDKTVRVTVTLSDGRTATQTATRSVTL